MSLLGYIALGTLLFLIAVILIAGRDNPPKGESHPGYQESRERVYWWRLIWRTKEGQDRDQDWSRD